MPVHFNEPLSFTQVMSHESHMTVDEYFFLIQRLCEDIEYIELLHKAAGKVSM